MSEAKLAELGGAREAYSKEVKRIGIKNIARVDGRLDPYTIIPICVKYVCGLADLCKRTYKCSDEQAIDWAIESYNGGFGNLKNEIPFLETYNHDRKINKMESMLFPQGTRPSVYH
jgi:hypothetical protein